MKIEACLVVILNAMGLAMRRGPHHPHGQTPVEHQHHHYKPRGSESLTADAQLLHDVVHIEEDTKELTPEALAKMTPEELEFHYFSAHDFDKNSKLDGLELLKAVYHTIEHEAPDPDADSSIEPEANDLDAYIGCNVISALKPKTKNPYKNSSPIPTYGSNFFNTESPIVMTLCTQKHTLVDRTLDSDDTDGDGFVSYAEYRAARANNSAERTPRVLAAN